MAMKLDELAKCKSADDWLEPPASNDDDEQYDWPDGDDLERYAIPLPHRNDDYIGW